MLFSSSSFTFFVGNRVIGYAFEFTACFFAFMSFIINREIHVQDKNVLILLSGMGGALLVLAIYHSDVFYFKQFLLLSFVFLFYFYCFTFISYEKLCKILIQIIVVISILGVFSFFVILLFDLKPFFVHQNIDGRPLYDFILTRTNAMYVSQGIRFIRYAGFFDEPGTMAFYIIFAFILNKLVTRSRVYEVILVLGGFFTFSLAFFIIIAFYYFSYLLCNLKLGKLTVLIIIGIVAILCLFSFSNDTGFKRILYNKTVARFLPSQDGTNRLFRGDNRTAIIIQGWQRFKERPLMGWGVSYVNDRNGSGDPDFDRVGHSAITDILAMSGLFGFIFIFLLFLGIAFKALLLMNIDLLIYTMMLSLQFIQRPQQIGFLTLFFTILIYIGFRKNISDLC